MLLRFGKIGTVFSDFTPFPEFGSSFSILHLPAFVLLRLNGSPFSGPALLV